MERRMLMAVVLSFLAVTAWSAMTGGCQPPRPKDDPAKKGASDTDGGTQVPAPATDAGDDDAGTDDGTTGGNGGQTPAPRNPKATPPEDHPHRDTKPSTATLQSDELEVGFTSLGGGVEYVRLRNIFEDDGKTPMDLIVPADPMMLFGQSDTTRLKPKAAPGGDHRENLPPGPMRTLHWVRDTAAEQASEEDDVCFRFDDGNVTLRKTWSLEQGKDRFGLKVQMSAWNSAGASQPVDTLRVKFLAASNMLREIFRGAFGNPNNVMVFRTGEGDVDNSGQYGYPAQDLPLIGVNPTTLRIFGTRTTYFMTTYFADTAQGISAPISGFWATGEQGDQRPVMEERLQQWFHEARDMALDARGRLADADMRGRVSEGVAQTLHAWMVVNVPVGQSEAQPGEAVDLHFFTGPIDRAVIGQEAYAALDPVVTYPSAPDIVAKFLLWIYDLWRGLTGSAGVAIILMTLCVRGGLMPLSIRNQLSMRAYGRKVAKLKPKLTALQQKYAKNPKRLREEQMKLYREHGVGFPSGCVMMLIQIPIFFALFSALRVEYSIRGQSFLWISDLAGPDRLIDFGTTLLDLGIFRLDALNMLPILMVVLSIWHTRSMPKPADEQQAQQMKMMKWMPIFFAFILYNYTAALALYMVFSSAIALIEAKIVRAKDDAATAGDAAAATA